MPRLTTMVFLVLCSLYAPLAAEDEDPEDVLKGKELRKLSSSFVLPGEADFNKEFVGLNRLKRAQAEATRTLQKRMQQWEADREIERRLEKDQTQLNARFAGNLSAEENNAIVGRLNVISSQLKELAGRNEDSDEGKKVRGAVTKATEEFTEKLIELRKAADALKEKYAALEKDEEVKNALETLNEDGAKFMLSSRTFISNVRALEKLEDSVLSETIKLTSQRDTFLIDTMVNGKTPVTMVFDTGASLVSLPPQVAEKIGLKPSSADETLRLKLADGRIITAKKMVLDSLRVGKFVVENVECAVLPKGLEDAEPLLGGSFLRNFSYKLDPNGSKVSMYKLDEAGGAKPATTKKTTKKKGKNK